MSYTNPERTGVMRRMLAAVGIGRGERTLALPAPSGEASPDAASAPGSSTRHPDKGGTPAGAPASAEPYVLDDRIAAVPGDAPGSTAKARAASPRDGLDDQLRRVREVLKEHDPLAPKAASASTPPATAPSPTRERVSLTVRLETPIDNDLLAGNPGRPSRIAEATLAQLPEGARIVGLVVETFTD